MKTLISVYGASVEISLAVISVPLWRHKTTTTYSRVFEDAESLISAILMGGLQTSCLSSAFTQKKT